MDIKCVVIEDDMVARTILNKYIEKTPNLVKVAEFENGEEAVSFLKENDADILFTDINLPGELSGLEMIKQLTNAYEIIFVTAEDTHAVEAFAHRVTDYLLKPIEFDRFTQAVEKAIHNIRSFDAMVEKQDMIFVRSEGKYVRIILDELLYVEALADYVIFNLEDRKHIVHYTMKGIEKQLPNEFQRVHRSYIINTKKIEYIEEQTIYVKKKAVPIGASYRNELYRAINII